MMGLCVWMCGGGGGEVNKFINNIRQNASKKLCTEPVFLIVYGSGIDSKELIPPAYVARRAGTITLFLFGS